MNLFSKLLFLTFIGPILIPAIPALADQRCDLCDRPITGTYYTYDKNFVICKTCEQTLPKCRRCGFPMQRWVAYGEIKLCHDCSEEVLKCASCGQPLLNKYFEFNADGKVLHLCQACQDAAVRCSGCGLPIVGSVYAYGAKNFCGKCNEIRFRCELCRRPVDRKYWFFDLESGRQYYCEDCYMGKAHCPVCGIPFDGGYEVDGKAICTKCYENLPHCGACGKSIISHSWIYPGSKSVYCTTCSSERPRCDTCGVPLGTDYETLTDERKLCASCMAAGIFTKEKSEPLFTLAIQNLTTLGFELKNIPELVITDRNHLERLARDVPGGDPDKTTGLYHKRNSKTQVYVITGLPKAVHLSVIAHELAHAWQSDNWPKLKSMELKEGFAEWVSYQVLSANKMNDEMEKIGKRDDVYGKGFKRLHAIQKKKGKEAVLEFLKNAH